MLTIRKILIALLSGILVGGGWWLFFDGIVYAPDTFPWVHVLPPIGSTITFICLNCITLETLQDPENGRAARVWIFVFLVLGCVSTGIAMWITAVEYPPDIHSNWPGVAIILQTVMMLLAAVLFFTARSLLEQDDYKVAL